LAFWTSAIKLSTNFCPECDDDDFADRRDDDDDDDDDCFVGMPMGTPTSATATIIMTTVPSLNGNSLTRSGTNNGNNAVGNINGNNAVGNINGNTAVGNNYELDTPV
jgi:hypothetical protein